MKTLILMRHGKTVFNERFIIQGWCDSPLTEEGIAQAKSAAPYLLDVEEVYSSTSERAMDTAIYATGKQPILNKGLKERHYGEMEGESRRITACLDKEQKDAFYVSCHGESKKEAQQRVSDTIDQIMRESNASKILCVSHGESISLFATKHIGESFHKNRIGNCSLLEFTYQDGKYEFIRQIDVVNE